MSLEKPKLFETSSGFLWTVLFLFLILIIRLIFEYFSYKEFITKPFYFTNATVLSSYEKVKNSKKYTVVKLHSDDGFTFYTTTHKKEDLNHKKVRIQIYPTSKISFKDYVGTFYVKSRIKKVEDLPLTFKDSLLERVSSQHENINIQSFYNAIFFATPVEKTLREQISLLGVSHLVALSGFHLSILWALVYGFVLLFYKPLQQKYFPYRHALFDVGLFTMLALGIYLWFVGFPPSLLRSYVMLMVAWVMLLMGIELLSFTFLTSVMFALLALFPSLLVSLSFWLSIAGVFYIFLLLQYTKKQNKWLISTLFIPVGIFILMLPIVHYIFAMTSPYQLLSPLLSLLFIPFYPLVMLLHLLGFGGALDSMLLWLFSLPGQSVENLLPIWAMFVYIGLSLGAIWSKKLFYGLLVVAMGYGVYLFII
ncbi:Competence protein [hydrothermal vent metagenome]|uniref:Competence protein n=1 Tax=hydrothermal vent metagenome TaxID=652676 RepID=A0A1W1ED37_9ZZZZ